MRLNVEKIVERGENLTDVDQRTEALTQSALQFQDRSGKLHRKFWLSNIKMKIALVVTLMVFIVVVVGKTNYKLRKFFWFKISHLIFVLF